MASLLGANRLLLRRLTDEEGCSGEQLARRLQYQIDHLEAQRRAAIGKEGRSWEDYARRWAEVAGGGKL
jgi:hypothetical protein